MATLEVDISKTTGPRGLIFWHKKYKLKKEGPAPAAKRRLELDPQYHVVAIDTLVNIDQSKTLATTTRL